MEIADEPLIVESAKQKLVNDSVMNFSLFKMFNDFVLGCARSSKNTTTSSG